MYPSVALLFLSLLPDLDLFCDFALSLAVSEAIQL
jgi:hypothetical protein